MKVKIKEVELTEWVNSLTSDDFRDGIKIKKGVSIGDVNTFPELKSQYTIDQLIDYQDYFIIDMDGHLCLAQWTRRKYKNSQGRVMPVKKMKELKPNVVNCVNGYWVIPDRFIIGE